MKIEENRVFCSKCRKETNELELGSCKECNNEFNKVIFIEKEIHFSLHKTKHNNHISGGVDYFTHNTMFPFTMFGSVTYFEEYTITLNTPHFSERDLKLQQLKRKEMELKKLKDQLML